MKSYKYKVLTLGMAFAGLASCTDSFLDKVPDERTEIDTEDKVVSLLVSAYPESCPAWVGEISSDNLTDNQSPHLPSSMDDKQILSHYNYSTYQRWDEELFNMEAAKNAAYNSSDSPGALWTSYYSSVATANQALSAIESIAPDGNYSTKLSAAKGEALLIRAYDHFMLVNIFSQAYKNPTDSKKDIGVPYVTEIEDVVQKNYDRINVDSVYKLIGKDLEEGLSLVSDVNYETAPKYHFNTNAAHAFAARYYLYTRNYEKVIEHANAVLGTDSAAVQRMLIDLSEFASCTSTTDYGNVWVDPELKGNLMLITTYSVLQRRCFGYRYSVSGPKARQVLMYRRDSRLWSGYPAPAQLLISGQLLSNSSHDYGMISAKAFEQFQYSDKVAGIGYAHQIYRDFTSNELLLERAEAYAMLGKYDMAAQDLRWYWNCSLNTADSEDFSKYIASGYTKFLTNQLIESYYGESGTSPNNQTSWSFTQNMSSDYVVPATATTLMNCINDFRRCETAFNGHRFFDLKRWGMEYEHVVGLNSDTINIKYDDVRRAIEVPWEALSAGLESSRETQNAGGTTEISMDKTAFVIKN